jgi:hypothetical protein
MFTCYVKKYLFECMYIPLFIAVRMLLNWHAFDRSQTYLLHLRLLRATAGDPIWLSNFLPYNFPYHHLVLGLLFVLFHRGSCCFLTGLFL